MEIQILKAQITANNQSTGQTLKNRVTVIGLLTEQTSEALGMKPQGDLDLVSHQVLSSAKFRHEIDKIGSLSLDPCEISKFKSYWSYQGRNGAKTSKISFQVAYSGNPLMLVEHMGKVGKGEGSCTIQALSQAPLELEGKRVEMKKAPKADVVPFGDPTIRYKDGPDFHYELFIIDGAQGWHYSASAVLGHSKLKQGSPIGPIPSEAQAIAAAGQLVMEQVMVVINGGNKKQSAKAAAMADDLQKYISQGAE